MSDNYPLRLNITRLQKHTPLIWSFFMTPQAAARPDFIAGQVAVLEMPAGADGTSYKPTYIAFASAPHEHEFEFLIKRSTSNHVTGALFDPHIAKPLALKEIVGRGFAVDEYKSHDLVFVAMGTGLAPLRSALRHILQNRGDYGRLIVLYGARTLEDFCFQEEMQNTWATHGVELRQVLSQPDAAWSGPTGYVQSLLDNLIPELTNPVALVCGSPEMMTQTKERLTALGFAAEKILTNY